MDQTQKKVKKAMKNLSRKVVKMVGEIKKQMVKNGAAAGDDIVQQPFLEGNCNGKQVDMAQSGIAAFGPKLFGVRLRCKRSVCRGFCCVGFGLLAGANG